MTTVGIPAAHAQLLQSLAAHLHVHGARAWIVGGYLRDLLLGRVTGDVDLAVDGNAPTLARAFADRTGGSWFMLDEATGTARIVWTGAAAGEIGVMDVAQLRAPTIEQDLAARDFTINALALPLDAAGAADRGRFVDPLGGSADLQGRVLRACGPRSLTDDPLRLLRSVRLAGGLHLATTPDLEASLREHHALITGVSAERIRDELLKILALPDAGRWLRYLDQIGLLTTIVPELEPARACEQPIFHFLPVLDHLLGAVVAADWLIGQIHGMAGAQQAIGEPPVAVQTIPALQARLPYIERLQARMDEAVDGTPRAAFFKLAVLLHDVAKPQTKVLKPEGGASFHDHQTIGGEVAAMIGRRLRLSRHACDYIRTVVREHMRPGQLADLGTELTMRAVYRFFRACGGAAPEVLLHSLCDYMAAKGPTIEAARWEAHIRWTGDMLQMLYEEQKETRAEPIVRGDDLMRELGLPPGPELGRLLDEIREAHAVGEIGTRDEALALARKMIAVQQA